LKLAEVVREYVTHKQSMGMRFCTEARTLKAFCRTMGDIAMTEVQRDRVDAYLAGKGPVTRFWQRKHEVLVGFYRFAIARGYALHVPLPRRVLKPAQTFVPYIYSHDELRRLLKATAACDSPHSNIESDTLPHSYSSTLWSRLTHQRSARTDLGRCRPLNRDPDHSYEQILQNSTRAARLGPDPRIEGLCDQAGNATLERARRPFLCFPDRKSSNSTRRRGHI
jgi:hypothetical protein